MGGRVAGLRRRTGRGRRAAHSSTRVPPDPHSTATGYPQRLVAVRSSTSMDWIFVTFVALLAIGLAVAVGYALDRERALEAARAAIVRGTPGSPSGPAPTAGD